MGKEFGIVICIVAELCDYTFLMVHIFQHNLSAQATDSQLLAAGHQVDAAKSLPPTPSQGVTTPAQSVPETPADTVAATPNGHGSVPSTPMDEALDVKPTDTKPLEKHEENLKGKK